LDVDDEIAAKLQNVLPLGDTLHPPASRDVLQVSPNDPWPQDVAPTCTTEPERGIRTAVRVGQQRERQFSLGQISRQPLGLTHRYGKYPYSGFAKLFESIRHLDQVGLARDSRQVAEEDYERPIGQQFGKSDAAPV
jgi:hypothetical protein